MSWSRLHAAFANTLAPPAPRIVARSYVGSHEIAVYELASGYRASVDGQPSKRRYGSIREAVSEGRARVERMQTWGITRGMASRAATRLHGRTFFAQSLVFPRRLYTAAGAREWAKRHGYRSDKVEAWGAHWRVRQFNPSYCMPGRQHWATVRYGKGIFATFCHVKPAMLSRVRSMQGVRHAA